MKRLLISSLALLLIFSSCKKSKDDVKEESTETTLEATLNGVKTKFTVSSATLIRDKNFNAKRMDITAISADQKHRVILTVANTTFEGNGMDVKDYNIAMFLQDDPNTPDDESMNDSDDGLFTYSEKIGTNNWMTDVWITNGKITLTANNANDKTVSGTFSMKLTDIDKKKEAINFTEGKFTNVKYLVAN